MSGTPGFKESSPEVVALLSQMISELKAIRIQKPAEPYSQVIRNNANASSNIEGPFNERSKGCGIEFAIWRGDRPSIERVDVVTVRRPGIEGVGSNVLPKYGREQFVEAIKYVANASKGSVIATIRALEGTIVTVEYHGVNFTSSLLTNHLVRSAEVVKEQRINKVVGIDYAGSVFDIDNGWELTVNFTLVPVAA